MHATLRRPGTSVDDAKATGPTSERRAAMVEAAGRTVSRPRGREAILNLDPPDHTRLRSLVSFCMARRYFANACSVFRCLMRAAITTVGALLLS